MRLSKFLFSTNKEFPKDAESTSDKYLRKANLTVKLQAGVFYYTPMLMRVLKKVKNIIDHELESAGAQEVHIPAYIKNEPIEQTGKNAAIVVDNSTQQIKNGKDNDTKITYETAFTDLVRKTVSSYRQLPLTLYRHIVMPDEENRTRFGLIGAGENHVTEIYSYDTTPEAMEITSHKLQDCFLNIFTRLGLDVHTIHAGTAAKPRRTEFMFFTQYGSETVLSCPQCGYQANIEYASTRLKSVSLIEYNSPLEKLYTANIRTVDELVKFTGIAAHQMVKTVIFRAIIENTEKFVAVLIRGDLEINENKLKNHLDCTGLRKANEQEIISLTGAEVGFAGPFNLPAKVLLIADHSVSHLNWFLCGCNQTDYHNINVCFGSDLPLPTLIDLRKARAEDACLCCTNENLVTLTALITGYIRKDGTAFSEKMEAKVVNEQGVKTPVFISELQLNLSRIIAALLEQHSDENGTVWTPATAPYQYIIIPTNKDNAVTLAAETLYNRLTARGKEVLYDDRDVSVGVKFKDADLSGIPHKLIVGKWINEGIIEMENRTTRQKEKINIQEFTEKQ